ncbi:MAG: dTDP-4-dehydrorhamnose reductase, partial [Candidatus Azotimanducaceae bacterium]
PYTEADRPLPTIDYGRDKRDAEDAVMLACPTAVMIRTSLLYGTGQLGHVQLDVQRALSTGSDRRPMTFFTDEYRCPVHAADVANAIAELATRPDVIGPLNVAGPDVLSRSDFARATATWMGQDPNRLPTSTIAEAGVDRPARIALDTSMAAALGITCRSVSESYGLG